MFQGPCCTASCTLKFGDKCRSDNGCRDAAFCDGKRANCPQSRHKPNRTRCDKELVCYMGVSISSMCFSRKNALFDCSIVESMVRYQVLTIFIYRSSKDNEFRGSKNVRQAF